MLLAAGFSIYAPERVLAVLNENPIFGVLAPDCVARVVLPLGIPMALAGTAGVSGLTVEAFAVPVSWATPSASEQRCSSQSLRSRSRSEL